MFFFHQRKFNFRYRKLCIKKLRFWYLKSSLYKCILFIANNSIFLRNSYVWYVLLILKKKKKYFHNIQYFSFIERIFFFVDILQGCWWYDNPEYLISSKRKVNSIQVDFRKSKIIYKNRPISIIHGHFLVAGTFFYIFP